MLIWEQPPTEKARLMTACAKPLAEALDVPRCVARGTAARLALTALPRWA